ncbi:TPA_asm: P3 [Artemisia alphacytorhabdovirus 1]|nr:TPA_asm: P3 [Artemisia alphacytorhabdovirus 1]
MSRIVNVNSVRQHIVKSGSLTSAIGTGLIYKGKYNQYAKKRELTLVVTASGGDSKTIINQCPIFDQDDLDEMRKDMETNKYIHVGCITISIEPMMHQRFMDKYGDKISGHCAIVDASFRKLDESIVSIHKYNLKKGRADYVTFPNHCLSLSDETLGRRLSLLLGFKGLDVDAGAEMFSVCIGYIVSAVNTLHPTPFQGSSGVAIQGTEKMDALEMGTNDRITLEQSYNKVDLITAPSDNDHYFKSKGNMLWKGREIKRRTMRAKPVIDNVQPPISRCLSARMDPTQVYDIINKEKIKDRIRNAKEWH